MAGAYFYPYSGKVIDHAAEQTIERGPEGLTLGLTPGYDFPSGPAADRAGRRRGAERPGL
jgi:hypothetical protein